LGSRDLETGANDDCKALGEAVALASGLMLDVSRRLIEEERTAAAATSGEGAPGSATPPSPPPAPAPLVKLPDRPPLAIPESPRRIGAVRVEPSLGVELAAGLLPGVAVGARAGVAIAPSRFAELALGATFFDGRDATVSGGRGAEFQAFSVDAALCPLVYR